MTNQRMTQRFRGNALLPVWVCGMLCSVISVSGMIVPTAMARVPAATARAAYLPSAGDGGAYFDFDPTTAHDKSTSWMATSVPMLSIPALNFEAGADTLKELFRHSVVAIGPVRGRAWPAPAASSRHSSTASPVCA